MRNFALDVYQALRGIRSNPGHALVIVLTMAVGIGACVAFFAYLSSFLWPTMQAPDPDRLVWIYNATQDAPRGANSYLDWQDLVADNRAFSRSMVFRFYSTTVKDGDRALHAWGHAVGGDYFGIFAARPEVGRLLQPADDRPDAERVVVLHHFFWRRHFGADPDVVGKTIKLDSRHPYTVVGVTRRGFQGQGLTTGVYVPMATATWLPHVDDRGRRNALSIARLAPDATIESAAMTLTHRGAALDEAYPEDSARDPVAIPISTRDPADDGAWVTAGKALMAAVLLLLLLACANVANLMLARMTSRRRELGIHAALGANRWRLGRRLLIEAVVLSTAGGVAGLLLAERIRAIIVGYLLRTVPIGFGEWAADVTILADNRQMTLFFVAACVGTGLLFGAVPAFAVVRADLVAALKGDDDFRPGRRWRTRELLVVAQVALSVLLLLGAGLLVRTVHEARAIDYGFDPEGLEIAALFTSPADRAGQQADAKARYEQILEGVRALPGVEAASLVNIVPLSGGIRQLVVHGDDDSETRINYSTVSTDYFRTFGIPLLSGRALDDRDRDGAPLVGVVNQHAADAWWPGEDPLGKVIRGSDRLRPETESIEIVGVVADSRFRHPTTRVESLIYLPYHQRFHRRMTVIARTALPIEQPIRRLLSRGFPDVSVIEVVPFREQIRRSIAEQRMNADLAGGFGLLGLLLAGLGIFSVTSYGIARRTREIGIRMAIGADRRRIRRLVLGEIGKLALVGGVIGLVAAVVLGRTIRSLLFGVGTFDTPTFVAVPAILAITTLIAAAIPTRRAVRVDPLASIRSE